MNSKRIRYTLDQNTPVCVKEYIILDDPLSNERYIIFKLFNNYKTNVKSLQYKITEYDENNKIVGESDFYYLDCDGKANFEFVPYTKHMVSKKCTKIAAKLIAAHFDYANYVNGEIIEYPKTRKYKDEDNSDYSVIKYNQRGKLFKCIFVISMILLVGLFGLLTYFSIKSFKEENPIVETETYQLHTLDSKSALISKFYGNTDVVIIPTKVSQWDIVGIDDGCFKYSNVKTVELTRSNIIFNIGREAFFGCENLTSFKAYDLGMIAESAFEGCNNLKISYSSIESIQENAFANCNLTGTFKDDKLTYVGPYAFSGCSFEVFNCPKALLSEGSLYNHNEITTLIYGDYKGSNLLNVFQCRIDKISKIETNCEIIPISYFDGIPSCELVLKNEDVGTALGALKTRGVVGYEDHGNYETINGKIISYSSNSSVVSIKETTTGLSKNAFYYSFNSIIAMEIHNDIKLDTNIISSLPNLETLTITSNITFEGNTLADCQSLTTLILDGEVGNISNAFRGEIPLDCNVIIIGQRLLNSTLSGFSKMNSLEISSSITSIDNNALNDLVELTSLKIPPIKSLSSLGTFENLQSLRLVSTESRTISSRKFVDNLPSLRKLEVDGGFSNISLPLIGDDCPKLQSIIVPYVGTDFESPVDYQQFNQSYQSTKYLTIKNQQLITGDAFEGCSNIERLALYGSTTIDDDALKGLTGLVYLRLNKLPVRLSNLFEGPGGVVLRTIEIETDDDLNELFFYGMTCLENIILKKTGSIDADVFAGLVNLKNIYFGDVTVKTTFDSLSQITFENRVSIISLHNDNYGITNPRCDYYYNVDFDSHYYVLNYENEIIYHYGVLIDDLDYIVFDYNDDETRTTLYDNSSYTKAYSTPFFNTISGNEYYVKTTAVNYLTLEGLSTFDVEFIDSLTNTTIFNQRLIPNDKLIIPPTHKAEYVFTGWYTDPSCSLNSMFDFGSSITSDLKLYAGYTGVQNEEIPLYQFDDFSYSRKGVYVYAGLVDSVATLRLYDNKNLKVTISSDNGEVPVYSYESNGLWTFEFDVKAGLLYRISIESNSYFGSANISSSKKYESDVFGGINYHFYKKIDFVVNEEIYLPYETHDRLEFVGYYTGLNGTGRRITDSRGYVERISFLQDTTLYAFYI